MLLYTMIQGNLPFLPNYRNGVEVEDSLMDAIRRGNLNFSPPHGICSEPITKISSFSAISATTPIPETSNSSCGNAAISFQCAFGQFCVDGSCTNAGDATKGFFTPAMIAIFAVAGIVLCLGSVLLCCLCKCCC